MVGKERDNRIVAELLIPAEVSQDFKHTWVYNAWRLKVTNTADPALLATFNVLKDAA